MKQVTIYTTPTCGYCKQAKAFFQEHDISYSEKDVSEDQAAQQEMIEKSGQRGVPVMVIGDEIIVGFDQPKVAEMLGV